MDRQDLIVNLQENVLMITLNRPNALNAFSTEMKSGLMEALQFAKRNPEVKAVLLSGSGRSFCAGEDVKEMAKRTPADSFENISRLNELILAMGELEVPIVSSVHGYAAGGGACLALASDMILAAEDSQFVFSFSKRGIIGDMGAQYFLARTIGSYRAKEVLMTAQPISAVTAFQWGMVNHLYPPEKLMEEAFNFTKKLTHGSGSAMGLIKKVTNKALISNLTDILDMERSSQFIIRSTTTINTNISH
ncbi:enoyl-CoA hydratase/isomerase family protein [Peribacillus frigoritolerans]